jgi:hypothetical protein
VVFAQLALTLLLLLVCSFAPGFFFVRRLRWSPLEKLCASVGLSLVAVWLAAWSLFLANANGAVGCFAITAASIAMGAASFRDAKRLFRSGRAQQTAACFGALFLWTLLMLASIRHSSGAGWTGDWLEQFSRCLFYLHHFPKNSQMFGGWAIPARPPFVNVLAAFFMAQAGDGFEIYQLIYTFFNLLVFLPCCLMLPAMGRTRRGTIPVLACLFALSPLIMANATYAGAKGFAAFHVCLGAALYLRGWRKRDRVRTIAAFVALAAGLLTHYSAAPYCVFFALHYLLAAWKSRPNRWQELAAITGTSGALMLAWFGWSIVTYGARGTFAAPVGTSVAYGPKDENGYLLKSLANLFDSVVPHVLRSSELTHAFDQPSTAGYLRDNTFVIYQTSLIFSMGIFGGPLVVWFLIDGLRRAAAPWRRFWLWLIAFSIATGLAVVGERDFYGVGHLTLISLFALGLTLLASRFGRARWAALVIIAGCAIDFGLGVFLQARVEHEENSAHHTVFAGLTLSEAGIDIATPVEGSLSAAAWGNWFRKHQYALSVQWRRDLDAFHPGDPRFEAAKAAIRPTLDRTIDDEERVWHGWYRDHGGETVFFGDHFGGGRAPLVLLALAGIAVLWKMARMMPPAQAAATPAPKPRSSRSRYKR